MLKHTHNKYEKTPFFKNGSIFKAFPYADLEKKQCSTTTSICKTSSLISPPSMPIFLPFPLWTFCDTNNGKIVSWSKSRFVLTSVYWVHVPAPLRGFRTALHSKIKCIACSKIRSKNIGNLNVTGENWAVWTISLNLIISDNYSMTFFIYI